MVGVHFNLIQAFQEDSFQAVTGAFSWSCSSLGFQPQGDVLDHLHHQPETFFRAGYLCVFLSFIFPRSGSAHS